VHCARARRDLLTAAEVVHGALSKAAAGAERAEEGGLERTVEIRGQRREVTSTWDSRREQPHARAPGGLQIRPAPDRAYRAVGRSVWGGFRGDRHSTGSYITGRTATRRFALDLLPPSGWKPPPHRLRRQGRVFTPTCRGT